MTKFIQSSLRALLAIGLIAVCWLNAKPVQAQDASQVPDPWMDTVYTSVGQTFNVPLNFGTLIGIRSFQFDLSFNPSVLQLNSISEGGYLSSFAAANGATVTITPASINNVSGQATGFGVTLKGASGQADSGSGVIAILNFTALSNGKSQTNLTNLQFLDAYNTPIQNLITTGGLVWVGSPPQLEVTSLQLDPEGLGPDHGLYFGVSFTVKNNGGYISGASTAMIYAVGALPPASQPSLVLPALASGASYSFDVQGYKLVTAQADVTVGVAGDSTRTAVYLNNLVTSAGQTPIDAVVNPAIRIDPDAAVNFGSLQLGANVIGGAIEVQCNTDYEVDVTDNDPTAWHMTEYDGSRYKNNLLQDALSLKATGFTAVSAPGGKLLNGSIAGQGPSDSGQIFLLSYFQSLHYGDPMPAAGDTYHLVLTFNGFVTL